MDGTNTLPIYVTWDQVIQQDTQLLDQAMRGIRSMLRFTDGRREVKFYGPGPWSNGEYGSVPWYLDQCRMANGQIDAQKLVELQLFEPWRKQQPHIDFMLTGEDMTAKQGGQQLNFVFGLACSLVSVQSVWRFVRGASSRASALECVWLLAAHEFGHVLGLLDGNAPHADRRPGLYQRHCTNCCVMKQVMSVPEAERLVVNLRQQRRVLCPQCIPYLARAAS